MRFAARIQAVTKDYVLDGGTVHALRGVDLDVPQGDYVAVMTAGAYGFTQSSNYNSRPRVPEVLVDGSEYRVIRKRETYEDLVRGETV